MGNPHPRGIMRVYWVWPSSDEWRLSVTAWSGGPSGDDDKEMTLMPMTSSYDCLRQGYWPESRVGAPVREQRRKVKREADMWALYVRAMSTSSQRAI